MKPWFRFLALLGLLALVALVQCWLARPAELDLVPQERFVYTYGADGVCRRVVIREPVSR